jgi:hypothetical protein
MSFEHYALNVARLPFRHFGINNRECYQQPSHNSISKAVGVQGWVLSSYCQEFVGTVLNERHDTLSGS